MSGCQEAGGLGPDGSAPRRLDACPLGHRGLAGLVSVLCLAMLVVGTQISPDARGHGTHEQLGLPACGWAQSLGAPCPTCGMTTAVALAVRGNLPGAFLAQPMGLLIALGASVGFWAGLHVAVTGSNLGRLAAGLLAPRVVWIIAGVAAVSWAYKWLTWRG